MAQYSGNKNKVMTLEIVVLESPKFILECKH